MYSIRDEVMKAASEAQIKVFELPSDIAENIRMSAANKFANGKTYWLWEHLEQANTISIQNPDAWQWISDFIASNESYMFFNLDDNKAVFRLMNGLDVVSILGETSHFEFYLTNTNADYLLCFNHHDYLVATGTAKDWLAQRIASRN